MAYGLTAIELVYDVPHFDQFDDNLIAHLKRLTDRDVRFSLHCPFLEVNLSGYFEEVRSFSRQLTEKAVHFAARAGCNPVVIHPGYTFLMDKIHGIEQVARSNMVDALTPLAAFAARHGITLGLENLQTPYFLVHDLKDFLFFKRAIPELGLVLDLGHAYIVKRRLGSPDPEGAVLKDIEEIGVRNVIHVHLSNNAGVTDEHGFINGDIDIKRVVHWLGERGYQGRLIIESTEMESLGIPAVLERIRQIEA